MTLIAASREEIQTASLASLRVTSLAPMVMPYSFLEEPRAAKHTSHSQPSRLTEFPDIIPTHRVGRNIPLRFVAIGGDSLVKTACPTTGAALTTHSLAYTVLIGPTDGGARLWGQVG